MDAVAFVPSSSPLMCLSPVALYSFLRNPFQVVFGKRAAHGEQPPWGDICMDAALLELRWAEATLTQ